MIVKIVLHSISAGIVLCASFSSPYAAENYSTWPSAQKIVLNTSSTGANVSGHTYGFPVLIRLNPSNFTGFDATLALGADVRFAKSNGTPLPYEIERWVDGSNNNDTAEIWVRIDTVLGNNSTQFILMHWGKADAISKSSSSGVFVPGNGFLAAYHLGGTLNDASGNNHNGINDNSMDTGAGIIGRAIFSDRRSGRPAGRRHLLLVPFEGTIRLHVDNGGHLWKIHRQQQKRHR
jgi:hypothetical protein